MATAPTAPEVVLRRARSPSALAVGTTVWLASELMFFAGLWTRWTSVCEVKEGETTNDLFAFLTTEPNAEVKAIHPKAMPVILTTAAEAETWLTAPAKDALALQRPLPDGALRIVARGEKTDGAEAFPSTPEQYAADIDREETKWSEIVRRSGAKAE